MKAESGLYFDMEKELLITNKSLGYGFQAFCDI